MKKQVKKITQEVQTQLLKEVNERLVSKGI